MYRSRPTFARSEKERLEKEGDDLYSSEYWYLEVDRSMYLYQSDEYMVQQCEFEQERLFV